ncbi:VirK/YbjX family protein [Pragia fontium]|uniref:VirK/YbjX family protein n=1 Tax=Pragia fontium TaxID=82985 RepID=UPI000E0F22EA|nr:VirK/YbjX family protein [Pragia fontium]
MKQIPKSAKDLMISLVKGRICPNDIWKKKSYRTKFLLRSLLVSRQTLPLLQSLVKYPNLSAILAVQPSLPCKLHRPYLAANLSKKQARKALESHYQSVFSHFPAQLREGMLSKKRYRLADIKGKDDTPLSVSIMSDDRCNREGEITLFVQDHQDITLAKITFTIVRLDGKICLFIGGCQGANQNVDHTIIQQATKVSHGLFPKRMALEGLRSLGRHLHFDHIVAVGDNTHIYHNWRYRIKRKEMHASYDEFWRSQEGEKDLNGYFHLPLSANHKAIEDIASKKRAEYRRRYALLEQLDQEIGKHFTTNNLNNQTDATVHAVASKPQN